MFKAEIQTGKVDAAEFERLKRFFMRLEIIAHAKEDFDVRDHFNEKDPDYNYMMIFMKDGQFDYKNFIADSIDAIGTGFARVINGYEELVDKYCDPESLVLEAIKSKRNKELHKYFKENIQDNVQYKLEDFVKNSPVKISEEMMKIKLNGYCCFVPGELEFHTKHHGPSGTSAEFFKLIVTDAPKMHYNSSRHN